MKDKKINAACLNENTKILYFQEVNEFCILLANPRKTKHKNKNGLTEDYDKQLDDIVKIFSNELNKKKIKNNAAITIPNTIKSIVCPKLSYVIKDTSFLTFFDACIELLSNERLEINTPDSSGTALRSLIHEIEGEKDTLLEDIDPGLVDPVLKCI